MNMRVLKSMERVEKARQFTLLVLCFVVLLAATMVLTVKSSHDVALNEEVTEE